MQLNKENHLNKIVLFVAIIILIGTGCRPTRHLSENEYLLVSHNVEIDNKDVDKREIESYFKQRPNRKTLLLFHMHLSAYNFSKRGKARKWKNWVGRVIGEEPSIFDSTLMDRTNKQFGRFMENESFYNVEIENEVHFKRKKAKVTYHIASGEPTKIRKVDYVVKDEGISHLIYSDTASSLLKPNERLRLETLENERTRIVNSLRDSGYYRFSPDYISYLIDTLNNKAQVIVNIDYALEPGVGAEVLQVPHKKYWIDKVFIYPDFNPQLNIRNQSQYQRTFDTINYEGYYFVYPGKVNVKQKTILKANLIEPNTLYNQSILEGTDKHINSLRIFRLNSINFQNNQANDSLLNCQIRLTPYTYQNFSINLETTNTQGNIGLGGYLNYQHKNLFNGAEVLNIKLSGAYERQDARNIWEVGAEAKLETPAFVLPFKMQRFYNKYYPKTSFLINYTRRQKPDEYTRNLFTVNMGYNWKGTNNVRHFVFPIDMSVLTLPHMDSAFEESIKGEYTEYSFKEYFIFGPRYVLTKTDSDKKNFKNYSYFRLGMQAAGNLSYLFHSNTNYKDTVEGGYYTYWNTQYAQFFKTDIDYRFYNYLTPRNHLVYRVFAGVVVPYGNAKAVPFVRQYSSGGSEGMRAWQARRLGPGTYQIVDSSDVYPDQYGDVKLELNLEYRYDITHSLKGAYFIDVGNIWTLSSEDERVGGEFKFSSFYKQLALGTGLGIRYDFGITVIRLDVGVKVRDPSISGKDSWVLFNTPLKWDDMQWNFGIGYPF